MKEPMVDVYLVASGGEAEAVGGTHDRSDVWVEELGVRIITGRQRWENDPQEWDGPNQPTYSDVPASEVFYPWHRIERIVTTEKGWVP